MTSAEAVARSDAAFDGRDFDHLPRHERERYIKRAEAGIKADPVRAEMLVEMKRFLPIIERAEYAPHLWDEITKGTGIATANSFRAAIAKAEASND